MVIRTTSPLPYDKNGVIQKLFWNSAVSGECGLHSEKWESPQERYYQHFYLHFTAICLIKRPRKDIKMSSHFSWAPGIVYIGQDLFGLHPSIASNMKPRCATGAFSKANENPGMVNEKPRNRYFSCWISDCYLCKSCKQREDARIRRNFEKWKKAWGLSKRSNHITDLMLAYIDINQSNEAFLASLLDEANQQENTLNSNTTPYILQTMRSKNQITFIFT